MHGGIEGCNAAMNKLQCQDGSVSPSCFCDKETDQSGMKTQTAAKRSASPDGPTPVRQKALQAAEKLLGAPYRSGGQNPQGTDCSGLIQQVYGNYFGQTKMNADQQFHKLEDQGDENIHASELEPGDAIYFEDQNGHINHAAVVEQVASGNDRPIHIIAASSNPIRNGVVRESLRSEGTMDATHHYAGGGRPGRHLQ
jgi:cell wall-associated NlpC family hydrolase